jgi:PAS domain-containing protein
MDSAEYREELLLNEPGIAIEIAASKAALPILEQLLETKVDTEGVVQAYFMGQSGTVMIVGERADGTGVQYRGMFKAKKYFPARPYFWDTYESKSPAVGFDNVTVPYIDYGGQGLVRTYSMRMELPESRWGMVALDCRIGGGGQHIRNQIERIDDDAKPFRVVKKKDDDVLTPNFENAWSKHDKELVASLVEKAATKAISEFTGEISSRESEDGRDILFTVPVGWSTESGTTELYFARIDRSPINKLWPLLAASVLFFGFAAGGIGLLIAQYASTRKEQEHLLKSFSTVMSETSVPFAWVNERNEFEEVNERFLKLLKYDTFESLAKVGSRRRTFLQMIDEGEQYRAMLANSERGESTGPRWWTIRCQDGSRIRIRVHGEGVLVRRATSRDRLHRFGVVLECDSDGSPASGATFESRAESEGL